ncbi:MAG TPA: alpha/beta hydrolase [Anaerolineales bacterium]|nr:alpha/beta hydrolase [Anaerolineales bacterium]
MMAIQNVDSHDDELIQFEAEGTSLPEPMEQGFAENDGAQIWYATFGQGAPVILLHGGMGNSQNWGKQVPTLVENGYQVIVVDSRGQGRSTRDAKPYSYELMASDVLAVMDKLQVAQAGFVGWSDGACVALILGATVPARVVGVFFFACNMDPSGAKEFVFTPVIGRCLSRLQKDYQQLSQTPEEFEAMAEALGLMQRTQPNYSAHDLAQIRVPVTIVHSEHDEFIRREHAEYLARSIPGAKFIFLPGVSHFAPIQRPELFNAAVLEFLRLEGAKGKL